MEGTPVNDMSDHMEATYPENTVVVDLDEVGVHLQTLDGVPQSEITEAIYTNSVLSRGERDNYESRVLRDITLSDLKRQYDGNLFESAMKNLQTWRTRIRLEEEDQFPNRDPLTIWNSNADRRLDYMCAMGGRCGFDAAIANRGTDIDYNFALDIKPHLSFFGRYAQLGADQKEGLLRVGSLRASEEVYIYMCPKVVLGSPQVPIPKPGLCTGPTRMQTKHVRILMIYIAHCLAQIKDESSVYCNHWYDIPLPPEGMNWGLFTNA